MSPDSSEDPSSTAASDAAKKAAERAKRMAAFSAKAIDEEDAPVSVRSFNQAREGADAGKTYSHKTGRVEDAAAPGTGAILPRKAGRGPSKIDDDELLREIDAAVDAAEGAQPLPDLKDEAEDLLDDIDQAVAEATAAPPMPHAPPGMNARRLAAMAAAAHDKSDVHAPPPAGISGSGAPKLPKGLASLAAGDDDVFLSDRPAKPKGPTTLSEDDLSGLRPMGGVKPSSARVASPQPPADEPGDGDEPTVVSGRGRGAVRRSEQDDDDLLAEIDAAVEAAERGAPTGGAPEGDSGALKSEDGSSEDVADDGKGKPKYTGPAIRSPGDVDDVSAKIDKRTGTGLPKAANPADSEFSVKSDKPKPAPAMLPGKDFQFNVKSDKPKAAGGADPLASPGKFDVKLDREEREAPKIKSVMDAAKFDVQLDKEEREAPKIRNPTEAEHFEVSKDQSSDELAKSAIEANPAAPPQVSFSKNQTHKGQPPRIKSPGDEAVHAKRDAQAKPLPKMQSAGDQHANVRRDAEAKPLPKMHSAGDEDVHARQDAERKELPKMRSAGDSAVDARMDREHREAPKFKGLGEAPFQARQDRDEKGPAPKIRSPAEGPAEVRQDREHREAPKFKGLGEAPFQARQDREHREAPKIRSPADAEKFAVSLDRAARDTPMPKMANPAEGGFETKRDAQSHEPAKLRSPADSHYETKQDAQSRAPPKLRNPTEAESFEAKQDAQRRALPKMRSAADAETYETKQDAQHKPLPKLRNATDDQPISARRDAQAKPLPHMMSPADVDAYEARVAKESRGGIPSMRSPADAESYETKFAWRQKEVKGIRNAADDETAVPKQDRQLREKVDVHNPGQDEFDVKYEHESVWTTKPKRDVDQTPSKKKGDKKGQ